MIGRRQQTNSEGYCGTSGDHQVNRVKQVLITMYKLRNDLNRRRSRVPHLNIFLHICLCFMSIIMCKHSGKSYDLKLWRNCWCGELLRMPGRTLDIPLCLFFSMTYLFTPLYSFKSGTKQTGSVCRKEDGLRTYKPYSQEL